MAPFKSLTIIVLLLVFIGVCFFPHFRGVLSSRLIKYIWICWSPFWHIYTHNDASHRTETRRNISGYARISACCTHTSTHTHTHTRNACTHTHRHTDSIPVGGVSARDCEVHKFQNSKVKHPLLKRRLDYFTGVSIWGRHTVDHVLTLHNTIKLRLWAAKRDIQAKIRAGLKAGS